jgi:hypothetical protein
MNLEKYSVETDQNYMVFEFVSLGAKGRVVKIVQYSEMKVKNYYNLGFGDKDETTGKISDKTITNNGDSHMVLSTVASTVYAFTSRYPNAWIYAKGSSISRNRLYRIGLTNNLDIIRNDFKLFGLKEGKWHKFKKDIVYDAYLLRRKII